MTRRCLVDQDSGTSRLAHINGEPHLALARDQVEVADSDPRWQPVFDRLAAQLRSAIADLDVMVEHVGSTSVPGLAAKPIIDIAVGVRGPITIDRLIQLLEPLGISTVVTRAQAAASCSWWMKTTGRRTGSPTSTS
jgi:GrpB-like predicted nucleotidyltransferase (UPF0157 family)